MRPDNRRKSRKELTRTAAAANNLRASVAGIFVNLTLSFFSRKIFVLVLGKEFVGLQSLVGNLISLLSLLDFGAASAVIYRLYRPLSEKDYAAASSLLSCYGVICRCSALLTAFFGLLLLPSLPAAIGGFDDAKTLAAVYFIYLFSSVSGYFFAREKALLFADQKNYIAQVFSYCFGAVTVLCESAVLVASRNYVVYLSVHTLLCLCEDFLLARYVRSLYPEIAFSSHAFRHKKVFRILFREILLLQPTNIAGTLLRTSDNFLVARLFGVAGNGIYSNYNMLLGYASMLSVTLVGALSASVGNLGASASRKRAEEIFNITALSAFFLINVCTTVLFVLSGDLVTLWLGSAFALPHSVAPVLALHFFVNGMRRTVMIFRDAYGLYRRERIKPFLELATMLAFSYLFGKKIGICGVYLGQALAAILVCAWYEPLLVYRCCFGKSPLDYARRYCGYLFVTAVSCLCCAALCRRIPSFSLKAALCAALPTLFAFAAFYKTREMKAIFEKLTRRAVPARRKIGKENAEKEGKNGVDKTVFY